MDLNLILTKEAIENLAKIQQQTNELSQQIIRLAEVANGVLKQYQPLINEFAKATKPHLIGLSKVVQTDEFKRMKSVQECKTILHPIYVELLEPEFSIEDIESNWRIIRQKLFNRFPDELDNENRKNRYNQILKCQTIGAYIPVCRSIYSEVESLFRDEIFLADPAWKEKLDAMGKASARRQFQSKELSSFLSNRHGEKKLFDEDATLSEVGMMSISFFIFLKEAFQSFDPVEYDSEDTKSFRHVHAHGWAKEADFIDAFNGLLAFDYALQIVVNMRKE
ncbi:MAG: hypothetical protein ABJO86_14305 [Lentilitoribacter sp.]